MEIGCLDSWCRRGGYAGDVCRPNQVFAINLGEGEIGYLNDGVGVEGIHTNNYELTATNQ